MSYPYNGSGSHGGGGSSGGGGWQGGGGGYPQDYGQGGWSQRGYEQPPPSGYGAGYPPPYPQHQYGPPPPHPDEFRSPPEVAHDPNAFRRFLMAQLATLTFNSKPVITNLTLFAHQHMIRMAPVVSSCLDDHLRTCPPPYRLPALYLLDSISKNIGPPYITLFARIIERTFLTSYQAVDPPTKVKMEELLGTWRTGGSDGGELFKLPDEGRNGRVQHGIESQLFGLGGKGGGIGGGGRGVGDSQHFNTGMAQLPSVASAAERSGVLFDVRRLLSLRQDQAILHPDDAVNKVQIGALERLESLVLNTQLTSDQVYQIREQLHALDPAPAFTPPLAAPPIAAPTPPAPVLSAPAVVIDPGTLLQGIDLNLLAQLKGLAGVGGLLGAAVPAKKEAPAPVQMVDPLVKQYDDALLATGIQLTNADLQKSRPHAYEFLYNRFGLQCKQCGLRFLDTLLGKKSMDKHLDWHFTHKRRIREGAGRAQGRSWMSLEADWLHSDDVDTLYASSDAPVASSSSLAAVQKAAAQIDRAELMKRKVIAPVPSEGPPKPCGICKEAFKSEWSESDEEWMFYNAEKVDGVIYHATCHASALASRRLKLEDQSSTKPSRESTPVPLKPPLAGLKAEERAGSTEPSSLKKRKLQEEAQAGEGEAEGKRIKAETEE